MSLPSGKILANRYQIDKLLGKGACGAVYLARDTHINGKIWAVKELIDQFATPAERAEAVAFFRKEAEILSELKHDNLPKIIDYFSEGNRQYLVMEYLNGETLQKIMEKRSAPFPETDVILWGIQLSQVLEYLHGHKPEPIIFRDLKPSNIMVSPDGILKLIDFGIARFFDPGKTSDTVCLGTPGYAAPEQYPGSGCQSNPRSDTYALGAILHQLLTARDPVATPFQFPPVSNMNPSVSAGLSDLIKQAVNVRPDLRIQSAKEFRICLEKLLPAHTLPSQKQVAPYAFVSQQSFVPVFLMPVLPILWLLYINKWLPLFAKLKINFNPNYRSKVFIAWLIILIPLSKSSLFLLKGTQAAGNDILLLSLSLVLFLIVTRACFLLLGFTASQLKLLTIGVILIVSAFYAVKAWRPGTVLFQGTSIYVPSKNLYMLSAKIRYNDLPNLYLGLKQMQFYLPYAYPDTFVPPGSGFYNIYTRFNMIIYLPSTDYKIHAIFLFKGTPFVTRENLAPGDTLDTVLKIYGAPDEKADTGSEFLFYYNNHHLMVIIQDAVVSTIIIADDIYDINPEWRIYKDLFFKKSKKSNLPSSFNSPGESNFIGIFNICSYGQAVSKP